MVEIAKSDTVVGPTQWVSLPALFAAFFWLGITSFGGGTAGWLHHQIVRRRHWIDDPAFLSALALGRLMPGSGGVNLTVQVGQRLRGAAGAAVAISGLLSGPLVITIGLAVCYVHLAGNNVVHAVLDGIAAAAIGLTFATGFRTIRGGSPGIGFLAITAVTVLCVGVLRWPMLPVLLCLAPISIGLSLVRRGRRHG